MRDSTFKVSSAFIETGDCIIDLGCSRGEALERLFHTFGARCRYVGVDVSAPMLKAARWKFRKWGSLVEIETIDLRHDFPTQVAGVIQAVLLLCFIPMEYRQKVVANCYKSLKEGGALVVVEKILGETAELDKLFVENYLAMKKSHDYSQEDIDRKRLSLEGVLVPITSSWLVQLLRGAGFKYVDCYWRWMNFGGFVAIK